MAAPTSVKTVSSAFNSAAKKTTESFAIKKGDLLIAKVAIENGTGGEPSFTVSGGSLTWTKIASDFAANSNIAGAGAWTATATADATITVTAEQTAGGSGLFYGVSVQVWRNHGGVGKIVKANGGESSSAPSSSITTEQANSAVEVFIADWDAATGTTAWRTGAGTATETLTYADGTNYGVHCAYHADAGSAGAKEVGMTKPSQRWRLLAIEVKGEAGNVTISVPAAQATALASAPTPVAAVAATAASSAAAASAPLPVVGMVSPPAAASASASAPTPATPVASPPASCAAAASAPHPVVAIASPPAVGSASAPAPAPQIAVGVPSAQGAAAALAPVPIVLVIGVPALATAIAPPPIVIVEEAAGPPVVDLPTTLVLDSASVSLELDGSTVGLVVGGTDARLELEDVGGELQLASDVSTLKLSEVGADLVLDDHAEELILDG